MRSAPLVSADQVVTVVEAYADRVADAARRLGCPPRAVPDVVEQGGLALVEACVREPEYVEDLLGRWIIVVRSLSARARLEATSAGLPVTGTGPIAVSEEAATTAAALEALDERRRLALLLRDSYDVSPTAAAVALGLTVADAQTVVAEARLRLVERLTEDPVPSLAGHEPLAGISLATLGALADGSDPVPMPGQSEDPVVRARRRHVGGCETCAAVLNGQTRARAAMAGLPVLGLSDEERDALLLSIATSADAALPTDEELVVAGDGAGPLIPRSAIIAALVVAILVGVGVGALLRHNAGTTQPVIAPTASPATTATSTPSDTPTVSASPTMTMSSSPSPSASPTPSMTPSPTPPATPTPARTPKPTKSHKPTPKPTASTPTAATAAPTIVATTSSATPTSASATPVAPAGISAVGNSDGTVSVTGTGFTPNATVTLSPGPGEPQPGVSGASATADATGAFSGSLSGGSMAQSGMPFTVTASDGSNTAMATYTAG